MSEAIVPSRHAIEHSFVTQGPSPLALGKDYLTPRFRKISEVDEGDLVLYREGRGEEAVDSAYEVNGVYVSDAGAIGLYFTGGGFREAMPHEKLVVAKHRVNA